MTLPPSALHVLGVLATRGPLTHKQLLQNVPLPARTVRFALARLRETDRIVEHPSLRDARQTYYAVPAPEVPLVARA